MVVPIDREPSAVLVENESVVKNTSIHESTLKKKHVDILIYAITWSGKQHQLESLRSITYDQKITNPTF